MNHATIPEEPSPGWALLTRLAFVGCLILLFGGLALMLLPELKSLRESDQHIADLKAKVEKLEKDKQKLEDQSILLSHDKEFVEYTARDELGMKQPGEKIFRFVGE